MITKSLKKNEELTDSSSSVSILFQEPAPLLYEGEEEGELLRTKVLCAWIYIIFTTTRFYETVYLRAIFSSPFTRKYMNYLATSTPRPRTLALATRYNNTAAAPYLPTIQYAFFIGGSNLSLKTTYLFIASSLNNQNSLLVRPFVGILNTSYSSVP